MQVEKVEDESAEGGYYEAYEYEWVVENTPLFAACKRGHTAIASMLLAAGADANLRSVDGRSPLGLACMDSSGKYWPKANPELVTLLINAKAALDGPSNSCGGNEQTALHTAAWYNAPACAELLINAGANVNQQDHHGKAPLGTACQEGHHEMVSLLLRSGAMVDLPDHSKRTPMQIGSSGICGIDSDGCHSYDAPRRPNLQCVQILSAYGASRDLDYSTASEHARYHGHEHVAAWLDETADWVPLHHVEFIGASRTRDLLRGGADMRNGSSPTPLEVAHTLCERGLSPVGSAAELLLRASEPWSPANHDIFPTAARARAVALVRQGFLLSREPARLQNGQSLGQSFMDVWRGIIMPFAVHDEFDR